MSNSTDTTGCISHRPNSRFFIIFEDFRDIARVASGTEHEHKLAAFWRVLETKTNDRITAIPEIAEECKKKDVPIPEEYLWIEMSYSDFVRRAQGVYKSSSFQIAAAESERLGFSKSRNMKRPVNPDEPDSPQEDYKEYLFFTNAMQTALTTGKLPPPIEINSPLLKAIPERKKKRKEKRAIEKNRESLLKSIAPPIEINTTPLLKSIGNNNIDKDITNNDKEYRERIPAPESDTPTVSPPSVGAARADYPLITFADCLTYLEQQGVPARGDDAVQIMVQARTLYADKHSLPSKTEAFIEKLREWRIEDEQPEEDITQAETVKVQAVSKQNTSTPTPAQAPSPQSEQAALGQCSFCPEEAELTCRVCGKHVCYFEHGRRFPLSETEVEDYCLPCLEAHNAAVTKALRQKESAQQNQSAGSPCSAVVTPDNPPSGVPPTKGKGKKQAEPKPETSKSPPAEPASEMAWGTRKCLLWFDYWRGGILIGKFKLMQASTCAKGLAEQFSEQQVIETRTMMEADPYYINKGGCDVCDVANNIHKYLKRRQQTKKPAQSTNAAQSQPITNIRELVRQREALRAAAAVQVGV